MKARLIVMGRDRWRRWPPLPGLAVRGVRAAVRAELLHLEPVRIVAPVLLRDVVAVLAVLAGQCDLWTDVGGLRHGGLYCFGVETSCTRRKRVAEAGLEPA